MTDFIYFHCAFRNIFSIWEMCNVFMIMETNFYSFTRQGVFVFVVEIFRFLFVSFYFYFEFIGFRHKWHIHFVHDKLYYRILGCHCRHSPFSTNNFIKKWTEKEKKKNRSGYQIWNRKNHNKAASSRYTYMYFKLVRLSLILHSTNNINNFPS